MSRAAELVERALSAASGPVVAYATEHAEANLRWAGNALTTNGEMTSTDLTVVATATVDGGIAAGMPAAFAAAVPFAWYSGGETAPRWT